MPRVLKKTLVAAGAGLLLAIASGVAFGDTELWRLDLATESGEVAPEAFSAWMEANEFKPFKNLLFKRRPKHWRIGPCEDASGPCLVMQENGSSSHIIHPFEPGLPVEDALTVELAYVVKRQASGARLDQKDREDAPLRIFLSFRTEDGLLHLALTDSAAHAAGTVARSEREPDSIRYYMLPDRTEGDGFKAGRFPVKSIFQKVFGPGDPGELVAIGIKSDSNNLGGESLAYLKTLRLVR